MVKPDDEKPGIEAINKLKSTEPPLFLSPSSDLSYFSRLASQHLFASLKPYSPKSPFDQLLSDGFDAEQIWQQIDLQSQPLITSLKREIKRYEKDPDQILAQFGVSGANGVLEREIKENGDVGLEEDSEEFEELSDEDEDEERENGEFEDEEEEEEEEEEEDDDESGEEEEELEDDGDGVPEVEDDFLKIKELEKYLVREEEKEYGSEEKKSKKKKKKKKGGKNVDDDEEDKNEENEEDDDDGDELLMYGGDGGYEDGSDDNIRYEDFYVPTKKMSVRKRKLVDKSDDSEMEDEKVDDSDDSEMDNEDEDDDADDSKMEDDNDEQNKGNLSTYEKEREKIQAKIKQMEAENLAPKDWTMQGEISASKRPVDSALEVDLDFEHNIRPPPVITEEVTASLEEIIKKRILEGNFDDVQRAPKLPSAAPKETKELDDHKSKKGLAEIYEDEYAQQTGFASAPLSMNDELKKEASDLFKRLCLKLDALSHFHFAPKPVVEDMSIQTNVPALTMEEVAPVAVSDAAMLAPEEVFSGKKNIKEDNELTKEDRKKRRAKKKRKFKAVNAKKAANRAPEKPSQTLNEGKEQ